MNSTTTAELREGKTAKTYIMFHLTITVDGVNRFVTRPAHDAVAVGYIQCDALGGKLPVEKGMFNLFVDQTGHGDQENALPAVLQR